MVEGVGVLLVCAGKDVHAAMEKQLSAGDLDLENHNYFVQINKSNNKNRY